MKLKCVDQNDRDFELVRDKLVRFGFDPVLLDNDDSLISTSFPTDTGVVNTLKLAMDGITPPTYIYHWSKRSKKINPTSIPFNSFFDGVEWLAFLPSIEVDKETSLSGKLDSVSWVARFLTKVFRLVSGVKDRSSFRTMIFGENTNKFQFNYGYKFLGIHYIENAKDDFLLLRDEAESVIAVHPSLIGYTNKVLICSDPN
jgi:hypothetical protein